MLLNWLNLMDGDVEATEALRRSKSEDDQPVGMEDFHVGSQIASGTAITFGWRCISPFISYETLG